jgi:hypothetical protein
VNDFRPATKAEIELALSFANLKPTQDAWVRLLKTALWLYEELEKETKDETA